MKRFLAIVMWAALSSAAQAQGNKTFMTGFAASKCSSLEEGLRIDAEFARRVIDSFLSGFLSGYNLALGESKRGDIDLTTSAFPDPSVRTEWLIASCKKNPNSYVYQQAYKLMKLLRSTQD